MRLVLDITNALADESRLRLLCALRGRELCVCQMVELLQLATSTVSKHLSILRHAGLIQSRKDARWMYYRLAKDTNDIATQVLDWLWGSLAGDRRIASDAKHLKAILKESPEAICKRQACRQACEVGDTLPVNS